MSGSLLTGAELNLTDQQRRAVDRRVGSLLLSAGAGSGKTSVFVERFVRAVLDDGTPLESILAITFTEAAAAEIAERVAQRFTQLGRHELAEQVLVANITTVHGFCSRLLRAHSLAAGVDPAYTVLSEREAHRVADLAFEEALEQLFQTNSQEVLQLLAAYGVERTKSAVLSLYGQLRSAGATVPKLPDPRPQLDFQRELGRLIDARQALLQELAAVEKPGKTVLKALTVLDRADRLLEGWRQDTEYPELAQFDSVAIPGRVAAPLKGESAERYREALGAARAAVVDVLAAPVMKLFGLLVELFDSAYTHRKRESATVDFDDLELLARDLLQANSALRDRYAEHFKLLMVDEFQDINPLQIEILELLERGNLFVVGDEYQSIYGFRHADVGIFRSRRELLAAAEAVELLTLNFRSRGEVLAVLNRIFGQLFGERFDLLEVGRDGLSGTELKPATAEPQVEILLTDRDLPHQETTDLAQLFPDVPEWRLAEARLVAKRIGDLIAEGRFVPGEVAVLLRSMGSVAVYDRALRDLGINTYLVGGRGYWEQQQVGDIAAYLAILVNPLDELQLYTTLASQLCGVSPDTLTLLALEARNAHRSLWESICALARLKAEEGQERNSESSQPTSSVPLSPELLDTIDKNDCRKLLAYHHGVECYRASAPYMPLDRLVLSVLEETGYLRAVSALPFGAQRVANLRKLSGVAEQFERSEGRDLRGFVDYLKSLQEGAFSADREAEAPIGEEAADAVQIMTVHRAKGLEFPLVCVADLSREPGRTSLPDLLVDGDRAGLRLVVPGSSKAEPALGYEALLERRRNKEREEELRLLYVAATRAREQLILSGAVKLQDGTVAGDSPFAETVNCLLLGPGEFPTVEEPQRCFAVELDSGEVSAVQLVLNVPEQVVGSVPERELAFAPSQRKVHSFQVNRDLLSPSHIPSDSAVLSTVTGRLAWLPERLSYTQLSEYSRCPYRFYLERVLGLPAQSTGYGAPGQKADAVTSQRSSGRAYGVLFHALMERQEFSSSAPSSATAKTTAKSLGLRLTSEEVDRAVTEIDGLLASPLLQELATAEKIRREYPFVFALPDTTLIEGIFDLLAIETDRLRVVDYKTDRLAGSDPAAFVSERYSVQRDLYALAALKTGVSEVEVTYCFAEVPDSPVMEMFSVDRIGQLEQDLIELVTRLGQSSFPVTETPSRGVCGGCPGRGTLCSYGIAETEVECR